jgi:hypothetical protein
MPVPSQVARLRSTAAGRHIDEGHIQDGGEPRKDKVFMNAGVLRLQTQHTGIHKNPTLVPSSIGPLRSTEQLPASTPGANLFTVFFEMVPGRAAYPGAHIAIPLLRL